MATRGSSKARSVEHEEWVAKQYRGKRSESSGAADHDQGDVRDPDTLFECKTAGSPGKPKRTTLTKVMEKIADEAWAESREPAICLRYFDPDSPLANRAGYVDFSVRLTADDAVRSQLILDLAERASGPQD